MSIKNNLLCSIYAYLRTVTEIHICLCCRNYLRKSRHLESEGQIQRSFSSTPTTWSGTPVEMDRTNIPATPKDILSFAWQISKGMAYLSDIKVSKTALLTLSIHSCQASSQKCDKLLLAPSCLPSVCPSIHMEHLGSHRTDFHEILLFHEYMSRIFKFDYDVTRTMSTLQKDLQTFMIVTPSTLL